MKHFRLLQTSRRSSARRGRLTTTHGVIQTPFFMPIATRGAVKVMDVDDLRQAGAEIILSNTYHLAIQPGTAVIKKAGGLHRFMGWSGPILTDSGGFQVFSLSKHRVITDHSVIFRDVHSGAKHILTPKRVIDLQRDYGSDILMILDDCPAYPSSRATLEQAMAHTTDWGSQALRYFRQRHTRQLLFGIVQGGDDRQLRITHAKQMVALGFDGYALGGLAFGEPTPVLLSILEAAVPELPNNQPRYLMGLGQPEQIVAAVQRGIDMFDCVLPTRNARHGSLYVWRKRSLTGSFYETVSIENAKFKTDQRPIDATCSCFTCTHHSRSYLRHLFKAAEPLALRLASIHNVTFYLELMRRIRDDIQRGKF